MTDNTNPQDLIALLRTFIGDTQIVRAAREAADVIEQKDARIAELEAVEPVAWYVPDDHGNVYMTTGYSHEAAQWKQIYKEVRPLYAAPVADSAMAKDAEAFRLMAKHRLLVGVHLDESWAQSYGTPEGEWITIKEPNGDDACAAARRAIDRAVAAIAASAEKEG